jgi:ABC-type Fe3+-hydroxamate transport system substrate-binding protein
MPVYHDQMNRTVELPSTPKRIISLVPSQTELLFDLGLNEEIAGITKFCIHPADVVKQKIKIGGTKTLNIKLIKEIKPDLIIGNKEENERGQIEELMQLFPVWMSDIADLPGALDMIQRVGELVGRSAAAAKLTTGIATGFAQLNRQPGNLRVAYLIWRKPYIVAGRGTFIDAMLQKCGFSNSFDMERYPEVTDELLIAAKPDLVFLSSEPYPFKEKHINEFKALLPGADVQLVDGEMFSWYGSRLLKAPAYFKSII